MLIKDKLFPDIAPHPILSSVIDIFFSEGSFEKKVKRLNELLLKYNSNMDKLELAIIYNVQDDTIDEYIKNLEVYNIFKSMFTACKINKLFFKSCREILALPELIYDGKEDLDMFRYFFIFNEYQEESLLAFVSRSGNIIIRND